MAGVFVQIKAGLPERNPWTGLGRAFEPRVALKLIGLRFTGFMSERFENDGKANEPGIAFLPGWAPLKPSTIAGRRSGSSRPLQDTGRLKQSYLAQPKTDSQTYVEVGSPEHYASYHEKGTPPYVIVPKTGKMLARQLAAGGWIVFGKRVNHPGIPARPVLPPTQAAERMMGDEIETMLQAEIKEGGL